MVFVVANPLNCANVEVFASFDLAVSFLTANGFVELWKREIKVSPLARAAFLNKKNEEYYIFCRELRS